MKRRFFTMRDEPCRIVSSTGKRFLCVDMFGALDFPDTYGLSNRRHKGAKCYEVEITIKRIKVPPTKPKRKASK